MAKKKGRRRKQGLISKAMNIGLIALGFSRVITLALRGDFLAIQNEATFGLAGAGTATSGFDLDAGLRIYSPAGAAVGLGFLKTYLMRKFPVR